MLTTFTPPAIVAPVEAAPVIRGDLSYKPTPAELREMGRHFTLCDALAEWPELAVLIQTARMLPDMVGLVEAFDGYAEPAARPAKATEATF